MKGKSLVFFAVAALLVPQAMAMPSFAASPNPYSAGERQAWPKWYYLDQLGLRQWHKNNRDSALSYFDQSFKLAEASLMSTAKPPDIRTKAMYRDVVQHQLFHMTEWSRITPEKTRGLTNKEIVAASLRPKDNENEKKLRFLERLERFAKRALGEKHLDVQAIAKHRNYLTPEPEADAKFNTTGRANHGVVVRPNWYTNNERDFTPELFTRSPRKVQQKPTETQRKMDVTVKPDVKYEKGISYSGGKRIDLSKPDAVNREKGWAANSSVGTVEVNNPNIKPVGWGAEGAANYGDQKTTDQTKWGIGLQGQSSGGKKGKVSQWGTNPPNEGDDILNKPWGGGGASQEPQPKD